MTNERFTLKLGRFYGDGQIMQNEEVLSLLNEQHETITTQAIQLDYLQAENQHMKNVLEENKKLKETLQEYYNEYCTKEINDIDPMVYASEVIDEIAEELGVDLE